MKGKKKIAGIVVGILLAALGVFGVWWFVFRTTPEQKKLIEGVEEVRSILEETPGVSYQIEEKEWQGAIDDIIKDIRTENLGQKDIYYRLREVFADIKCGHIYFDVEKTNIEELSSKIIPVSCVWFEDELRIERTILDYSEYLGEKIVAIEGISIEDFADKYASINVYETEAQKKANMETILFYDDMVYIGVLKEADNTVTYTIETSDGNTKDIEVECCDYTESGTWLSIYNMAEKEKLPISYRNLEKGLKYTYETDEENKIMYFLNTECEQSDTQPFAEFFSEMIEQMKAAECDTLVIDLRWNRGGKLNFLPAELRKNRLYFDGIDIKVITGKVTYSAAFTIIEDLYGIYDDVKTYGEPIGQAIHHYSALPDSKPVENLGVALYTPTKEMELPIIKSMQGDVFESYVPDYVVEQTYDDFLNGIDAAYESIVKDKQSNLE